MFSMKEKPKLSLLTERSALMFPSIVESGF
jgi:hypothetical protein